MRLIVITFIKIELLFNVISTFDKPCESSALIKKVFPSVVTLILGLLTPITFWDFLVSFPSISVAIILRICVPSSTTSINVSFFAAFIVKTIAFASSSSQ